MEGSELGGQWKVPNLVAKGMFQDLAANGMFQDLVANGRFQSLVANGREGKNTFSPLPIPPPTILLKPSIFPFNL
jgi:hypothetical protein